MKLRSLQYQDQKFTYADHEIVFPAFATEALHRILLQWQDIFPREQTLIQSRYNVPSLFVRFDCSISSEGQVQIYEIQDGPAWVGYTGVANDAFRKIRDRVVQDEWSSLKVLRVETQADKDDDLWLPRADIREALETPGPLIVRDWLPRDLSQEQRGLIIGKSVRPVTTHNNKSYGVEFGWWKLVSWEDTSEGTLLPWDTEFVLKPRFGFGSRDIMLWRPNDRSGRATQTQIKRVLKERTQMYLQPFIQPLYMELDGSKYNFIYRPYFIFSGTQRKWIPAHGVWTARPYPTFRIHGASDAISGPLRME